jgi:hypothetical protein
MFVGGYAVCIIIEFVVQDVNTKLVPEGYDIGVGSIHSVSPVHVIPETTVVVPVTQLNETLFSCAQMPNVVLPVTTNVSEFPEHPVHVTVHPLFAVIV